MDIIDLDSFFAAILHPKQLAFGGIKAWAVYPPTVTILKWKATANF